MEGSALIPDAPGGVDLNALLPGMQRWAQLMKDQTQTRESSAWSQDRPDQTPASLVPRLVDPLAQWAFTHVINSHFIEEIRMAVNIRVKYDLENMFAAVKIGHLLDGRDGYCRSLVAQFFANLYFDDDKLITWVSGVPILMYVTKFGEIVGVPTEGKETNNEKCDAWEPDELFPELFKHPRVARSHSTSTLPAMDLKDKYRIIHRLLQYLCVPKFKNHKYARLDTCQVMYAMAKGIDVNMASYMFRGLTEPSVNIPFACTLTLVFVDYGINMEHEFMEFFCKVFTTANESKLIPKPKVPVAAGVAGGEGEEEEGEITLRSLKSQLNRMEGTQRYYVAYNEARHQESRYNAQQLHAKVGIQYKSFPLPRRQDYPGCEEPVMPGSGEREIPTQEVPRRRSTRRSTQQAQGGDEGAGSSAMRTRSKGKKKIVEEEEEEWMDKDEDEDEEPVTPTKKRTPVKKIPANKTRK